LLTDGLVDGQNDGKLDTLGCVDGAPLTDGLVDGQNDGGKLDTLGCVDEALQEMAGCDEFELGACDSSVLAVGLADSSNEGVADREGDSVGCVVTLGL